MGVFWLEDLGDGAFWVGRVPFATYVLGGVLVLAVTVYIGISDFVSQPQKYFCNTSAFTTPTCNKAEWLKNFKNNGWTDATGNPIRASIDESGLLTLVESQDYLGTSFETPVDVVDELYVLPTNDVISFDFIKRYKSVLKLDGVVVASGEWAKEDVIKLNDETGGAGAEKYVRNLYFSPMLKCKKPNCANQR